MWGLFLCDPLQSQGLAHGFVIMKPERHQHRRRIKANHRWQRAGNRRANAKQQQRHQPQGLFSHHQQQKDHGEGQKPRYLTQALQDADLDTSKGRPLDGKVIDQRHPGRKRQGHSNGHQDHKGFR